MDAFQICQAWAQMGSKQLFCCQYAGEQLLEEAGEGGKIIMACEAGGSLIPTPSFSTGKESRSLKACT